MLHDIDTAVSDWILALLTFGLSLRLRAIPRLLFLCLSASSLLGGIYHGFFPLKTSTTTGFIVWIATLWTIGGSAICLWALSLGKTRPALWGLWITYAAYVLFIDHRFLIGILFYLPPCLYFLLITTQKAVRSGDRKYVWGVIGLSLTFVSAAAQQMKIQIHPVYFGYNALYHLIQGVAFFFLFRMLRDTE